MTTKGRFRFWGSAAGRLVAVTAAMLVVVVARVPPAAADLSDGCVSDCSISGISPFDTIANQDDPVTKDTAVNEPPQASDPAQHDREMDAMSAQLMQNGTSGHDYYTQRQVRTMLTQFMEVGTVVQDYYSQPYIANGMVERMDQVVPRRSAFSFNAELPVTSYAVTFLQPPPLLAAANGAAVHVPEPTSLALLGAGLAGLAFLRRRRYICGRT